MGAYFTDCREGELLARVARAYVLKVWRDGTCGSLPPSECIRHAYNALPPGFDMLKAALMGMSLFIQQGKGSSSLWVKEVTLRSRYGYDWRRCLYPEYKRNRRR